MSAAEAKGLKYALWGLLGMLALFALISLPSGAPLRNPTTGDLIGDSPFMNGLIVFIALTFLSAGAAYGIGAGTMKGTPDVIKAMEKAVAGLGGLIFLLFVISQFNAFFTYTNMATLAAVNMGDTLEAAGLGALPLLLGFVVVVAVLDLIMTGAIPKWAIFAPIFVPLLMRLGVAPEAVLAAYRVGDSPINAVSPLNAYFALIVSFAMKYQKDAGVGTVIALDAAVRRRALPRLAGAPRALADLRATLGVLTNDHQRIRHARQGKIRVRYRAGGEYWRRRKLQGMCWASAVYPQSRGLRRAARAA